jgi:hypothetical protein
MAGRGSEVGWWSVEFSLGECGKGVVRLLTSPCVGHIPFASLRFFLVGKREVKVNGCRTYGVGLGSISTLTQIESQQTCKKRR